MNTSYGIGKGHRERMQWRMKKMTEEGDCAPRKFIAMRFLHVSLVSIDVDPTDLISQGAKVVSKLAYKKYNYMPRSCKLAL